MKSENIYFKTIIFLKWHSLWKDERSKDWDIERVY